ncbi:MAG: galactokinase [Ruminococcaceae bacterium]|nr:galactokinase [Oscillospiraceae bacterium]
MKLSQLKNSIESGALLDSFKKAYVTDDFAKAQYDRYLKTAEAFAEVYGDEDREICLFSAPGRSEVCGNHTDHNHGCVLAAGISLDAVAVASKNDTNTVNIKSAGYKMDTVSCDDLCVNCTDTGRSKSLVRGMMARFVELGYNIGGFDATTSSKVLSGSGLSSSAAFEVLVGTMLNYLFNDGKISPVEIAQIAQHAENVHFGKPCGLMDQMACSVGGFVEIDFNDPAKPVINKVDFDFASCGHSLVIVDTKGSHSDLTDEYAAVRTEMEQVAAVFGKKVLREVDEKEFMANIALVRNQVNDRAVLRAIHFFNDSNRVADEVSALKDGDFERFKSLIIESGDSSYKYNQNVYACKKPLDQPVSLALALSESVLKGKGAWRVHGGGFAGTIQAFVPNGLVEEYTSTMKKVFGDDSCYILSIRPVGGIQLA